MRSVSLMFRDRLSPRDVAGVLSRFRQRPDPHGWVVVFADDREIAVEIGEDRDYDAMPPQMVKQSARALGIRFGKPKTRLVVMFVDRDDEEDWRWVFHIARAFAERWRVVVHDHAGSVYDNLTPGAPTKDA